MRERKNPKHAGDIAGGGSYTCHACDYALTLNALETIPACPACGGTDFDRASIFEHQPTIEAAELGEQIEAGWLNQARTDLGRRSIWLAFQEPNGERRVHELRRGWSRIGRSRGADLRLDNPSVSRRHALIIRNDDETVRALDDRSLNGTFVNGRAIDWAPLSDGDELTVGIYSLHLLSENEPSQT